MDAFLDHSNLFNAELFQRSLTNATDAAIVSPFSVFAALMLLYMGARGRSAEDLSRTLKVDGLARDDVIKHYAEALRHIEADGAAKLASRIFVKEGLELKPNFREIGEPIKFTPAPAAALHMNEWVANRTENKITNLVKSDHLNSDTLLVLLNAIYFAGSWARPFDPTKTEPNKFHVSADETIQVNFMRELNYFRYALDEEHNVELIELPYVNSSLGMVIVKPAEGVGIEGILENLNELQPKLLAKKLRRTKVDLKLPKFKIDFEVTLNNILKEMGMASLFEDADLGDLIEYSPQYYVSTVLHKAHIEVDEKGTVAAAATEVVVEGRSFVYPVSFNVNKPFLFYIIEKTTRQPIFNGWIRRLPSVV